MGQKQATVSGESLEDHGLKRQLHVRLAGEQRPIGLGKAHALVASSRREVYLGLGVRLTGGAVCSHGVANLLRWKKTSLPLDPKPSFGGVSNPWRIVRPATADFGTRRKPCPQPVFKPHTAIRTQATQRATPVEAEAAMDVSSQS